MGVQMAGDLMYNLHPASRILCPCCGEGGLVQTYLLGLFELQEMIGPDHVLFMTSGYRCWKYNRSDKVGSGDYSLHPRGMAGDLTCPTMEVVDLFKAVQMNSFFKGMGIYPDNNFVHTDVGPKLYQFGYWQKKVEKKLIKVKMSPDELEEFLIAA